MTSRQSEYWKVYRDDSTGMSLLMRAAKDGKFNLFKTLLRFAFTLDAVNEKNGNTVFNYVCEQLLLYYRTNDRLLPYFKIVLHFPLDTQLAASVVADIRATPTRYTVIEILKKYGSFSLFHGQTSLRPDY